jgi:hypothetical protein
MRPVGHDRGRTAENDLGLTALVEQDEGHGKFPGRHDLLGLVAVTWSL